MFEYASDTGRWWMRHYDDTPGSKALRLLMRMLNDAQRETYARSGYIECTGSLGTRYRIRRGCHYNVTWLDSGGLAGGDLCAAPDRFPRHGLRELPPEDVLLGQMLSLVSDEKAFLCVANLGCDGKWPPCYRWTWGVRQFCRELYAAFVRP
jgi:hypothetical protein